MHHCCNRMNEFYTKKKSRKRNNKMNKNFIKSNVSLGHFKILILHEIRLSIVCLRQFVLLVISQ